MTASLPRMIVADLDGTLLHDTDTFEGRFITRRSIDASSSRSCRWTPAFT